jgi:hypothetical protein
VSAAALVACARVLFAGRFFFFATRSLLFYGYSGVPCAIRSDGQNHTEVSAFCNNVSGGGLSRVQG